MALKDCIFTTLTVSHFDHGLLTSAISKLTSKEALFRLHLLPQWPAEDHADLRDDRTIAATNHSYVILYMELFQIEKKNPKQAIALLMGNRGKHEIQLEKEERKASLF